MNEKSPSTSSPKANPAANFKLGRAQSNCVPLSATSVQQSTPTISYRNRTVMPQPETIPPTPPATAGDSQAGLPPMSPLAGFDQSIIGELPPTRTHLLSVSQMVRQHSDTTQNRRLLVRSAAICDDRPATSSNTSGSGQMPILSPFLERPTRIVTMVDQETHERYMQLNQYRLMEEIGQGSYGIVKLAYNEEDRNLYAMKVLDKLKLVKNFACFRPPPTRRNRPVPSTYRNPLQLVLDDPNDNYLYMVFEYVERRSLLELPTDTPLDEETAWKYFRDTLKGLEYLHFQKIVHRDIKPSNLLLSETDCVKIADFGVSCEFEGIDAFLTGTAGAPAFMAPEALTGDGRAQDIWSLGITLYALVYGKVPFWDTYVIALHRKIKNESVHFPETPRITQPLVDLILGMLKKDPGHRLMLHEIKQDRWITKNGTNPMPSEEENCHLVTVTEEEIKNSVRIIPRLDTLILIKSMGHRKSFGNPFRTGSTSTTSLRLRRKSSSVRDPTYLPPSFDAEMTDMSGHPNMRPDRPSSGQSDAVLDAMEGIRIQSPNCLQEEIERAEAGPSS
ncbi:Protein kinase domain-containing protein [Aphelenchoides fujianensis]|nr:Protein kinase domain-containing protein [Aphelenchoides fujianensis]